MTNTIRSLWRRRWRILNLITQYSLVFSLCVNVILITRWLEGRNVRTGTGIDVAFTAYHRQKLLHNQDVVQDVVHVDSAEVAEQPFYVNDSRKRHVAIPAKATNQYQLHGLKRVKYEGAAIFLYSAVFGNSSRNASWDRLVFQGWQDKTFSNNLSCCVLYQSGSVVQFKARTLLWGMRPQMVATQYICPVKPSGSDVPVSVGMVKSTAKCHTYFNWYMTPAFSYRHDNQIAVCAKLAYGNLSADDILSWFEIHRRLGVDKILTYTYNLNPEAMRVLKYYQTAGLAEVLPFELPYSVKGKRPEVGVKNAQAWSDEQICVYNCLERFRGYKYVITIDFDEYLMPKQDTTLHGLFERIFKRKPNAAGFHLLTRLHMTSWGPTAEGSKFKVGQYLNSTKPMMDRMKHVVLPERILDGGLSTHGFFHNFNAGYKKFTVREDEATIHHFRSCRKDWAKKNRTQCMDLQRLRDTTVSDFMRPIEHEVLDLKRNILTRSTL